MSDIHIHGLNTNIFCTSYVFNWCNFKGTSLQKIQTTYSTSHLLSCLLSRLFWCELLSFRDIHHRDVCILVDVMWSGGTQLVMLHLKNLTQSLKSRWSTDFFMQELFSFRKCSSTRLTKLADVTAQPQRTVLHECHLVPSGLSNSPNSEIKNTYFSLHPLCVSLTKTVASLVS